LAFVWGPNHGSGYPFPGGRFDVQPSSPDYSVLDTNKDGKLDINDDPYSPYYPGDEWVDWVGFSVIFILDVLTTVDLSFRSSMALGNQ
jgi:hypothetical protein